MKPKEAMKVAVESLKEVYPEPRESEDKRIKEGFKNLLKRLKDNGGLTLNMIPIERCEAWLEKQKKQKPAEWSEEDEEMLEYVIDDVNDAKQLFATKEAIDLCDKEIAWLKSLRPQPKQEWSEEDEKNCNRIIRFLEPHKTFFPTKETKEEMQNWLKNRLKALRPSSMR